VEGKVAIKRLIKYANKYYDILIDKFGAIQQKRDEVD